MSAESIKQMITLIASQLQSDPALMQSQIDLLRTAVPGASEERLRALVEKVSSPGFDPKRAGAEVEALLKG